MSCCTSEGYRKGHVKFQPLDLARKLWNSVNLCTEGALLFLVARHFLSIRIPSLATVKYPDFGNYSARRWIRFPPTIAIFISTCDIIALSETDSSKTVDFLRALESVTQQKECRPIPIENFSNGMRKFFLKEKMNRFALWSALTKRSRVPSHLLLEMQDWKLCCSTLCRAWLRTVPGPS